MALERAYRTGHCGATDRVLLAQQSVFSPAPHWDRSAVAHDSTGSRSVDWLEPQRLAPAVGSRKGATFTFTSFGGCVVRSHRPERVAQTPRQHFCSGPFWLALRRSGGAVSAGF